MHSWLSFPRLAPALLVLAAVAAYVDSLPAPFIFDDIPAIVDNPTIRDLGDLRQVLSPPPSGSSVTARPLVNLSLAIDHALYAFDVRGFRATNIAIHALTGLLLWGLIRRTLARGIQAGPLLSAVEPASFAVALLWLVHPLQTETVTCIVQRTESLVSLFYLLTLYCFVRAADAPRPQRWLAGMVAASLAGMAAKEVMVTVPVMALFYDRVFLAGSFAAAFRQRWSWHLMLAATWALLGFLVLGAGVNRGMSAGLGLGITPWEYLLTQCHAITLYLKLCFWPHPLIADYGTTLYRELTAVLPQAALVTGLLVTTIVALVRRSALAFIGVWFFGLLAPSSSVIPLVTQTIAEHRMYLPLAGILVLVVLALFRVAPRRALASCVLLAVAAGVSTAVRNLDYRDEERLWRENARHLPDSARAHNNLGRVFANAERWTEAMAEYREALRLDPEMAHAHYNLGLALEAGGQWTEAAEHYARAVTILPHFAQASLQYGKLLMRDGRPAEARRYFQQALRFQPNRAEAHFQTGRALIALDEPNHAVPFYTRALEIDPGFAAAAANLGDAMCRLNEYNRAIPFLRRAIELDSNLPEAHFNLGLALARTGQGEESLRHYAEAVRLDPNDASALLNYGIALAQAGRLTAALEQLDRALAGSPDAPEVHSNRGSVLAEMGLFDQAIAAYRQAVQLRPDYATAHFNLGHALLAQGAVAEARRHFETALRLAPDFEPAAEMLEQIAQRPMGP